MTSLRSKWQNFFKFDGDFISEKYSQKFSVKLKFLACCLYFYNTLCSKLPYLNTSNDFCKKTAYKRVQKFLFSSKAVLDCTFLIYHAPPGKAIKNQ